jgi:hypothetical protein
MFQLGFLYVALSSFNRWLPKFSFGTAREELTIPA